MVTKLAFCRFGSNCRQSVFLDTILTQHSCGHSAAHQMVPSALRIVLEPGDFEAPDANILEVVIFRVGVSLVESARVGAKAGKYGRGVV
jgi:hypothetical protein